MADAVLWSLLTDIQTGLRTLTFEAQGTDTVETISDSAIVIRKTPRKNGWLEKIFQTERMPGIVIAPINVRRPPTAGTNVRDDAFYSVSIQIIAKDSGVNKERNLRSYLKWQEQIARYLHTQSRSNVQTYAVGQVCIGWTVEGDFWDYVYEAKHEACVGGVLYQVKIREPRG